MKNEYKVMGKTALVFLRRRSGEIVGTLVDTQDLKKLLKIDCMWYAKKTRDSGVYYAYTKDVKDPQKMCYLHRILTNAPKGLVVDHINHRTLDNRKSNLQVVTNSENVSKQLRHVLRPYSRGEVYWHKRDKRWIPRIYHNKKRRWLGSFKDKREAEKALLLYIKKIAD